MTKRLRYIYHVYVQIAEIDAMDETAPYVAQTYRWAPSEPVSTRPLVLTLWTREGTARETLYYAHDLRKNVVSLFDGKGLRRASYQYDPYGNITSMEGDMAEENPFRYSSEHHDEDLGLVYYNYRHYNPTDGRWINRDPIAEKGGWNLYEFINNKSLFKIDYLGLSETDLYNKDGIIVHVEHLSDDGSCIHIHYKKEKYSWYNQKNKMGFFSDNGDKLPKHIQKILANPHSELSKRINQGFRRVNRLGGFTSKYGSGKMCCQALPLFVAFQGMQFMKRILEYIDARAKGDFETADELEDQLMQEVPPTGIIPSGGATCLLLFFEQISQEDVYPEETEEEAVELESNN